MPSKSKRKRKPTNQCKHVESDQRIWDSTTAQEMERLVLQIIQSQPKPKRPFYKQLVKLLDDLSPDLCTSMGITSDNSDSTLGSHLRDIRNGKKEGCGILTIDLLQTFLPRPRSKSTRSRRHRSKSRTVSVDSSEPEATPAAAAEQQHPQDLHATTQEVSSDSEDEAHHLFPSPPESPTDSPEQTRLGIKRQASLDTSDCLSPTPRFLPQSAGKTGCIQSMDSYVALCDTAPPSPATAVSSQSFFDSSIPHYEEDDRSLDDYEVESLCSTDEVEEMIRCTNELSFKDGQNTFGSVDDSDAAAGLLDDGELVDELLIDSAEKVRFITNSFNEKNGGLDWLDVNEQIIDLIC